MTQPFSYSANDMDASPTSAKVAEIFLTAGHAFQKLGDLTLKLNQPITENTNETKWSEKDVERLKESLARFAQDLDNISESVQGRIVQRIKTDIKRRTMISGGLSDTRVPLNSAAPSYSGGTATSTATSSSAASTSYGTNAYGGGSSSYATSGNMSVGHATTLSGSGSGGGRLVDIKQEEYGINFQHGGQPTRLASTGGLGALKRTSPSSAAYSSGGGPMLANPRSSLGAGSSLPYKKPGYGGGVKTAFRPIRTISATVNSSPGGGHSISLARPGGIHSQQQRVQYPSHQRQIIHQQQQSSGIDLENSPEGEKSPHRDSVSPLAQQL